MNTKLLGLIACAGLALFGASERAYATTFSLNNVEFTDGGTAAGTVTIDSGGSILSWDITTTAGSILSGATYSGDASIYEQSVLDSGSYCFWWGCSFNFSTAIGGTYEA